MKLGSRLLLFLLPVVTAIMVAFAGWALAEREQLLVPEARLEAQAYATALGLAFEYGLRGVKAEDVRQILNQISQAPAVFGIAIYDTAGVRTFASDLIDETEPVSPDQLARLHGVADTILVEREIGDQRVFSVLRAIHDPRGRITGALEVAQPFAFIEAQKALAQRRLALNTLTLLGAVTLVTLWVVRRVVTRPLDRFVTAAQALGRGELAYRISDPPAGAEFGHLTEAFNRMAEGLAGAQAAIVRQADERLALERRLRESEKLAAIGNLAAGLAHEIAAPLNVISGRAEMLQRRDLDAPSRERHLRIIGQQVRRITVIVRNLLDFARRREPRLRPVELVRVIDGATEILDTELARVGAQLFREDARGLVVNADPDLLHQVFTNLLLNALQAMEPVEACRTIVIRSRLGSADGRGGDGEWAIVEVEDSGPGIPPDALTHLFEPFFTTKPQGTGLGLVVARSIVEEHGGRLEVANGSQGGAIFRVILPGWLHSGEPNG